MTFRSTGRLDDHRPHDVVIRRHNRRVSHYVISVSADALVGVCCADCLNNEQTRENEGILTSLLRA